MDKLISANELIDWIRNDSGDKLMADWYIEHINDMQEAYNPDRVVEQLEELKAYALYENMNADTKWLDRAVEIANKGGVTE